MTDLLDGTRHSQPSLHRLCSFDGGGIRGVISASVASELESRTGKSLYQLFDSFAGTSTGSIMASGGLFDDSSTGCPLPMASIAKLYEVQRERIFQPRMVQKEGLASALFGALNVAFGSKYDQSGLNSVMSSAFANRTLAEARKPLLIVSYNTTSNRPAFFTSYDTQTRTLPLCQAILASTAAPTYFEPYRIGDQHYVDGGIAANNPAMCLVQQCAQQGVPTERMLLVSLGTGHVKANYDRVVGSVGWATNGMSVMFDAASQMVDGQCRTFLGERYLRLQPGLERTIALDDTAQDTMERMKAIAREYVRAQSDEIDRWCLRLLQNDNLV
eukprot:TRINITY_DN9477_c0_g1_i1.p1 TRINITY_DN9477_c0_g1~~TRINITY_DN9477_c0_g1_i1.p1  ORF type:complete len:347 (+),score=37.55 TRINITY_DN9477_c0_g1_i1:56-1042(+)